MQWTKRKDDKKDKIVTINEADETNKFLKWNEWRSGWNWRKG